MAYVSLADLACCGMGDSGFTIYPDAQTALKQPQSYGYLYKQGEQIMLSGPAGPLIVKSTQIFQDSTTALKQPGAYGYVYIQNGEYYLTGPYGPLKIRSPYTDAAPPGVSVLSLPPPPALTTVAPVPTASAPTSPTQPVSQPGPYGVPDDLNYVPQKRVPPQPQPQQPQQAAGFPVTYVVLGVGVVGIIGLALVVKSMKKKSAQPSGYPSYPGYPGYGYQQPYSYAPQQMTPQPVAQAASPVTKNRRSS